jgi:hypothetical protein
MWKRARHLPWLVGVMALLVLVIVVQLRIRLVVVILLLQIQPDVDSGCFSFRSLTFFHFPERKK